MEFEDFYWHDSIIKKIEINREEFREKDTISLDIEWYNNVQNKLIFEDVYQAKLNMNFGIKGNESINTAFISENDSDLIDFYNIWNGLMDNVKLKCYIIKTASTGSEIKIIAKGFNLIDI